MKSAEKRIHFREDGLRLLLIILASVIMAVNLKSFVGAGGLVPGGFTGLTLLLQRSAKLFLGWELPFSLINFILNAVPAVISFRTIGKKFTIFSCLMIIITSLLTDLIPAVTITEDILLICVFGGIINGFSIGLCLMGRATSGGTDFIAVALSERLNIDAWNYILFGNAAMLAVAGLLFGWDKALYSVIFQFASTQIIRSLNVRYKRVTLFIISDKIEEIYQKMQEKTHHSATAFQGIGLHDGTPRSMLYTVISGDQLKEMKRLVRQTDPKAFINVMRTDQLSGNFYRQPND